MASDCLTLELWVAVSYNVAVSAGNPSQIYKSKVLVAGFSLSNYIKILVQQEACDWTGKREAELRVAETEHLRREEKPRWSRTTRRRT